MKLIDLIKKNQWLSVEITLLELYPDIKDVIDDHKGVFEKLMLIEPENYEMEIVLIEYEDFYDNEITTNVDVSGRNLNEIDSDSYALEFVDWKNWLGMELANETTQNFNELEIIAHCLYEMTFIGYEEDEIQEQLNSIKCKADEYKSLSEKEKKNNTTSLEDIIKKFNRKYRL